MKRWTALCITFVMLATMLAGCGEAAPENTEQQSGATEQTSQSTLPMDTVPDVSGEIYSTGEFQALVPDGWAAFPIKDAFSEENAPDTSCFNIIKGGTSDLDLFSKPYVRLDYYGPDTFMMKPGSEYFTAMREAGIILRHFDKDPIRDWVRITIGTEEQMQRLVDETKQWLERR